MDIVHISAECYPMAKTGGLADVVGALPKYQNKIGHKASVVMPMHRTKFLYDNEWEVVHKNSFGMADRHFDFTIIREKTNKLGFELYCVDINGLLDREKVYGYHDDTERFFAFQLAVMEWMKTWEALPNVINVHDHHAGLIPFMMNFCYPYRRLTTIKKVLTIHNAQYQGQMGWDKGAYFPAWDTWRWGLLDWNNDINPLACGIKCADKVNTVSPGYMGELMESGAGLESLFRQESAKCSGILNGIDFDVWDPQTDTYVLDNYSYEDYESGKKLNKKKICKDYGLGEDLPLFIFIGRLVHEKAADILPGVIYRMFTERPNSFCCYILGSGDPALEHTLGSMNNNWVGYYNSTMGYNEKLSHLLYAGADFLLMPSRVEPCGLNQMYALRYGTIPMVRRTGGLKDTVKDFGEWEGYGICFNNASEDDLCHAMHRAIDLFSSKESFNRIRKDIMQIDNSWEHSAKRYIDLYSSI